MKNYHLKALQHQVTLWEWSAARTGFNMSVSEWVREALRAVIEGKVRPRFTEEQLVRGRDPNRSEVAVDFQFRTEPEAVKHWKLAASQEGLGVQEWCRQSLDWVSNENRIQNTRVCSKKSST